MTDANGVMIEVASDATRALLSKVKLSRDRVVVVVVDETVDPKHHALLLRLLLHPLQRPSLHLWQLHPS